VQEVFRSRKAPGNAPAILTDDRPARLTADWRLD
jgi:hypothetical protein